MKLKTNLIKTTAVCLIAVTAVVGLSMPAFAASGKAFGSYVNPENVEYSENVSDSDLPVNSKIDESMEDFIKSLDMISDAEKDALLKAEHRKQPHYDQLNSISEEIDTKTAEILKDANPIFDKIFAIKEKNKDLWEKVDTNENDKQKIVGKDYIKFIQLSDVLSDSEKELLISDQKQIDTLYKDADAYYDKAERATADLNQKLENVIAQIQAIDAGTSQIWDKIYDK